MTTTQPEAKKKNWFQRHYIISMVLAFFFFLLIVGAMSDDSSSTTNTTSTNNGEVQQEQVQEVVQISATQLYKEYEENEIKADEAYEDKILEVSGNVESIGKDILDDMYVALEGDSMIFTVQCMLKGSEKEKAIELSEGDFVTMQGDRVSKLGNVILRNCIIQ